MLYTVLYRMVYDIGSITNHFGRMTWAKSEVVTIFTAKRDSKSL